MSGHNDNSLPSAEDTRLPYEPPELVDLGSIASITESGVPTTPGTDAGYS